VRGPLARRRGPGISPRQRVMGLSEIHNSPGQPAVSCRVGVYPTFLKAMLDRLSMQPSGTSDGAAWHPLSHWNATDSESWLQALLQAWAVAGDVLTFYSERIANEGYLRTALEDLSVRELVRALDYRPQPGTAARAPLAFTLAEVAGLPTRVTLARGTRIQSLPVYQDMPQTWETLEELDARVEWNELRPAVSAFIPAPALTGAATALVLRGAVAGLDTGLPLLVGGRAPEEERGGSVLFLRSVEKFEFLLGSGGEPLTRISWQGELDPSLPDRTVVADGLGAFVLRRRCQLFGCDAPLWSELPPEEARRYSPVEGGVLRSAAGSGTWASVNQGLPARDVRFLAAGADGALYAGGAGGVFRSLDGAASWRSIGEGLVLLDPRTLTVDVRGVLWLGTTDGKVHRSFDRGATWENVSGSTLKRKGGRWKAVSTLLPQAPVHCLTAVLDEGALRVWAGTTQGVFRSDDPANGWEPVNGGLPGLSEDTGFADLPVFSVAAGPRQGLVFAGTAQGVFRSADGGGAWAAASRGLPGTDEETGLSKTAVHALLVHQEGRTGTVRLFAGTAKGVFRSTDLGRSWQPVSRGLPQTDGRTGESATAVQCLAASVDPRTLAASVFAGSAAGLFVSGDWGETWVRAGGAAAASSIAALAVAADGALLAATPFGDLADGDWPGFRLSRRQVDLSTLEPSVLPGGWAVLHQTREGEGPLLGIYRIVDVRTVRRQDFALDRLVTRLEVETAEDLGIFDLRTAVVYVGSEPLEPWREAIIRLEPLSPVRVRLDRRLVEPFPFKRRVIVQGKPIRLRFAAGDPLELVPEAEGKAPVPLGPEDEVQVLASPPGEGDPVTLRVLHPATGLIGRVEAARSRLLWRSALADDAPTGEARDAEVALDGDPAHPTVLLFDPPLGCCLDPQTTVIHANVAEASQGGTTTREVLGSGDPSQAHQRFTLRQPLTYLRVPTETGVKAELEVRVNDVVWKEVPSLHEAGPRDQVYMVRPGAQGLPMVVFGDGVHGARLPAGQENVAAVYRTGMWTQGADPGHVILLQTRPFGLQGVTNPLAAPPGTPAEPPGEAKERAPRSVRTLGRIVSLSDYEDFAHTFPGVARAEGRAFWAGGCHLVHLTLAPAGGRVLEEGDPLFQDLARAIDRVREAPRPVRLDGWRRVTFDLAARVSVDRRYRSSAVEAAIRKTLTEAWSFEKSRFGATLTSAAAVALLEGVEGVVAVVLEAFHPTGTPAEIRTHLRAEPARAGANGRIEPAQLLLVNPGGVALRMEAAP
jgi:hypothetical protein